jgi:hypothetical protein
MIVNMETTVGTWGRPSLSKMIMEILSNGSEPAQIFTIKNYRLSD